MQTKIAGIGHYLPNRIIKNQDLTSYMDTTHEWIVERTGIEERRYAEKHKETSATMGTAAAKIAIERAGISPEDIDFIIFATLSPDYYFPGCGVLLQRELGITKTEIGALDIRNQCSGFVYGLSIADQFIKSGMYKNILLVGAEMHSMGLDFSDEGRAVTVIFGDGAGAVVLQPTEEKDKGILITCLHSDGTHAEELAMISPGSHGGYHLGTEKFGFPDPDIPGGVFVTKKMMDENMLAPNMTGQLVFKTAVVKFPEVIREALTKVGLTSDDIDLFVPHQANLRISQFVQRVMKLPDEKVVNNIQKYGNTTAASIPIALSEAWEQGRVQDGDLICLAAFGSGFTWGSALIRW
ncbi:MAG: beta-ketoacyl-ACP synthase III [Saprospiraceae bacterium]|jgi:3-oxoacyl-[acyl-carrier-protein] synthase-3|nr:ketoacyl-ACP synthase III [Saprospiraceae bacterium]